MHNAFHEFYNTQEPRETFSDRRENHIMQGCSKELTIILL